MKRRRFLQTSLLLTSGSLFATSVFSKNFSHFSMPDESAPHARTWMAFVADDSIWSSRQIPEVKKNLALIAATIAKYESVSILVSSADYREADKMLKPLLSSNHYPVELVEFAVDDLWLRDTGPTFVSNAQHEKVAIDFNFNGWGNKQQHSRDKHVARFIAEYANVQLQTTDLVLEGGCFEVDGHGTAIMTKSCIINDNRNPHLTFTEIEAELKYLLGLRKIIWLEGIKGKDITDGHTDFYARFIRPGEVIVSRENYKASFDYQVTRDNIKALSAATDANGKQLKLHIVDTPNSINERFGVRDFAAGYIGYYVCNGAVIAQKFGDKHADRKAREILQRTFPDRIIEQIAIDGIASGGGSIHCATQQEIAL